MIKSFIFIRALTIAAQPAITTSKEYFREVGVKRMLGDFKSQFFGLEILATEDTELAIHKLGESLVDDPILVERGDKAEIAVSQFRAFLLLNRGSSEWFVFYLRGRDKNLSNVSAVWSSEYCGWLVHACSIGCPMGLERGDHIVSRN